MPCLVVEGVWCVCRGAAGGLEDGPVDSEVESQKECRDQQELYLEGVFVVHIVRELDRLRRRPHQAINKAHSTRCIYSANSERHSMSLQCIAVRSNTHTAGTNRLVVRAWHRIHEAQVDDEVGAGQE